VTDSTPASVETASPKTTRRDLVDRLRAALDRADPGTLAALRRLDPSSPPPAFYRLSVAVLDAQLANLADGSALRDELESRWALLVSALALAQGYFSPPIPLGQALAEAGVAEMRLLRLLEARAAQLPALVRNVVHQLVQRGQPFDPNDLANLVLASDEDRGPRKNIARMYYRHEGT